MRYAFPGCADILGQLVTGHFLAIKVKRPGGRVGPAQRRFLAQVRAAGGLALLARGIPEVQAGLDHFLGGRASWVGTYPLPTLSMATRTAPLSAPKIDPPGDPDQRQFPIFCFSR